MARIIFLGKKPPPYIGPAIATQVIFNSKINQKFDLIHLDTSDHRDAKTLGRFDLMNLLIAIKQYGLLLKLLIVKKNIKAVYIPSQQTTLGYLRDIPFFLITKIFGKKIICHLRGGYFKTFYDSSSFLMKRIIRTFQPMVDCQIVLGDSLTNMFNDLMPKENIFVVPNGADYTIPERRRENKKLRILYLSNLKKEKGILDVLRAALILEKNNYDFELYCVGNCTEDETKKAIDKILSENSSDRIHILDPISGDEKFQMLRDSDIFILPTYYRYEGHPWAIVEAMAFGLPIISANHAAIPETVGHNQNGFLVEKQNPAEIAEKIMQLIDNPGLRKEMGLQSVNIYNERFTEEKMVEKLSYAFEKTLESD